MTAPQTPPPCPPWCANSDEAAHPAHRHKSRLFDAPAYLAIAQWPDEQPEIRLSSWDAHAPVLGLNAEQARMLADIAKPEIAAALRQAADELDRITGGA